MSRKLLKPHTHYTYLSKLLLGSSSSSSTCWLTSTSKSTRASKSHLSSNLLPAPSSSSFSSASFALVVFLFSICAPDENKDIWLCLQIACQTRKRERSWKPVDGGKFFCGQFYEIAATSATRHATGVLSSCKLWTKIAQHKKTNTVVLVEEGAHNQVCNKGTWQK